MIAIYVGCLALGGILILASILFGGQGDHDADGHVEIEAHADADVAADVDAGAADADHAFDKDLGGAGPWLPFLSLRFWTFFLASFGLLGVLLTLLGLPDLVTGPVSGAVGVGIGWAAAAVFRALQKSSVTGEVGVAHLRGVEAEVVVAIGPHKTGKVRVLSGGQWIDLLARTQDDVEIQRKEPVLIVSVEDGTAVVTPVRSLVDSLSQSDHERSSS